MNRKERRQEKFKDVVPSNTPSSKQVLKSMEDKLTKLNESVASAKPVIVAKPRFGSSVGNIKASIECKQKMKTKIADLKETINDDIREKQSKIYEESKIKYYKTKNKIIQQCIKEDTAQGTLKPVKSVSSVDKKREATQKKTIKKGLKSEKKGMKADAQADFEARIGDALNNSYNLYRPL
jgi:hypothetical protein